MKITVFTGNQLRHVTLINELAKISKSTYALMECNTIFPGRGEGFLQKTEVMRNYFTNVIAAEEKFFSEGSFTLPNVQALAMRAGDLSMIEFERLKPALESDVYVVFGASYIKGWLADFLVEKKAINIHVGVSPFYRGAACNFWALYDGNPHMIGATIHHLSKGLDNGDILYHALPEFRGENPFEFTMKAVVAAQKSIVEKIRTKEIFSLQPIVQDKSFQVRYSRNRDFTDEVAKSFLDRGMTAADLEITLGQKQSKNDLLVHPFRY